ncbi:MAG: hypothetical protein KGL64_02575 [Acidobacteriota bacterium]|nr:hypothetical protein [Acidobacteriota bacterium]
MNWKRPRLIGVGSAILSALGAGISIYFAIVFRFAAGPSNPTLTTDQILACLTLTVTLVGLVVAVAAIGIGVAAVFGFGELRQLVTRKTDETFLMIIYKLRQKGQIGEVEAFELRQLIENNDTTIQESQNADEESKLVTQAQPYPEKGDSNGNHNNAAPTST